MSTAAVAANNAGVQTKKGPTALLPGLLHQANLPAPGMAVAFPRKVNARKADSLMRHLMQVKVGSAPLGQKGATEQARGRRDTPRFGYPPKPVCRA